uniref:Ubiquitinspecific protease putative n=1 Tax=Albugo laibachii Nc14 TaxID=890382 RepID=F0X0F0_9STRA|nr:ubiquitinspecific protease putative [Albugo laibachii Nc14]|eukprot:CCA27237.1 ubiquitinspecific protease putative [Albugo laibachii Nc14]
MNAVLICLCTLIEYVKPRHFPSTTIESQDGSIQFVKASFELFQALLSPHDTMEKASLLERLRTKYYQFLTTAHRCTPLISETPENQQQHDAENFLSFWLSQHHEVGRGKYIVPSSEYPADKNRLSGLLQVYQDRLERCQSADPVVYADVLNTIGDIKWRMVQLENWSIITDLFTSYAAYGSHCVECGHMFCSHQEIRILSLHISESLPYQDLQQCLESNFGVEYLGKENEMYCDFCCHVSGRLRQALLHRTSKVIVIQLQRFNQAKWLWFTYSKRVDARVSFPFLEEDYLDLNAALFVRKSDHSRFYQLLAVCAHFGASTASGHYVSYIRSSSERDSTITWLRYDDESISGLSDSEFKEETESTAYLLFYMRLHDKFNV